MTGEAPSLRSDPRTRSASASQIAVKRVQPVDAFIRHARRPLCQRVRDDGEGPEDTVQGCVQGWLRDRCLVVRFQQLVDMEVRRESGIRVVDRPLGNAPALEQFMLRSRYLRQPPAVQRCGPLAGEQLEVLPSVIDVGALVAALDEGRHGAAVGAASGVPRRQGAARAST